LVFKKNHRWVAVIVMFSRDLLVPLGYGYGLGVGIPGAIVAKRLHHIPTVFLNSDRCR